jgi:hypothetical protein
MKKARRRDQLFSKGGGSTRIPRQGEKAKRRNAIIGSSKTRLLTRIRRHGEKATKSHNRICDGLSLRRKESRLRGSNEKRAW